MPAPDECRSCRFTAQELPDLWARWERGEDRCPHCLDLDAWAWFGTCDCLMAPEPTEPRPVLVDPWPDVTVEGVGEF